MPLTISTSITPVGAAMLQDAREIADMARAQGTFVPSGSTVVAITRPVININQTGLRWTTRASGREFQFDTGTLQLTLRQEIHISRDLSPCTRTIWLQHEQKHVADNEAIMGRMDRELRADPELIDILVRPTDWKPIADFQSTQHNVQLIVGEIFERLTSGAADRQDTAVEYRAVDRQTRLRCGHVLAPVVKLGMYGEGIDIVQQALNARTPTVLAPLAVDGVFGAKMEARVKEFQRLEELVPVDGIVGLETRRRLGL